MWEKIREKITSGQTIDCSEAIDLYQHAEMADLRDLATVGKLRHHSDLKKPTYLIMAIVNYTNICVAKCDYCAFYRLPHSPEGYLLTFEQVAERIDKLLTFGGTLVGFNGGFHPKLRLQDYAQLFAKIRERYGDQLEFYEMTVAEFMFSCKVSKMSYDEGAEILKSAGTRWITGGGAEVLTDSFRMRHSPGKFKVEDYYLAQQAILEGGLGSTATMVIGFDETLDERMAHLSRLRKFQGDMQKRGIGLTSFLCWTYKPYNTELKGNEIDTAEYLRWLAICRIYLDNFTHIRTSVLTKNEEALLGLDYGADDFDLPTDDEVTQKAGATIDHDFAKILQTARELGYEPKHRSPWGVGIDLSLELEQRNQSLLLNNS
jgi:cyclic dehypoxanthinyl futalosine synthase